MKQNRVENATTRVTTAVGDEPIVRRSGLNFQVTMDVFLVSFFCLKGKKIIEKGKRIEKV